MRQNKLQRQKEYFWPMGLHSNWDISYGVELFSFAVQKKCKRLILIHNHPSGNLSQAIATFSY